MDGFVVILDYVEDLWVLADVCQLERLRLCCQGSLEVCEENDVLQIFKEAKDLGSPYDELKKDLSKCIETNLDQR